MFQRISPLILPDRCEVVSTYLTDNLIAAGHTVVRSFDLQRARNADTGCTCPYHGESQCDCQVIVLLVYLSNGEPYTLLAHGRDGITYIKWDETLSDDEEKAFFAIIKDFFLQFKGTQESTPL